MTKERSLIRNTAVVGAGTFLSRITGLIREILVSSMFGASWVTDVFFVAYTIPNLLRRLFAEGALSTSVIPVFSQYSEKSHDESQKFIFCACISPKDPPITVKSWEYTNTGLPSIVP
jgi:putative peptidoglycan lipid II flippase